MADKYQDGATVYQFAEEFGICRSAVSSWIKKLGIPIRGQSPDHEMIDSIISLYLSGMSLAAVAQNIGTSPGTVHNHLKSRHVQMRDSHGRKRQEELLLGALVTHSLSSTVRDFTVELLPDFLNAVDTVEVGLVQAQDHGPPTAASRTPQFTTSNKTFLHISFGMAITSNFISFQQVSFMNIVLLPMFIVSGSFSP